MMGKGEPWILTRIPGFHLPTISSKKMNEKEMDKIFSTLVPCVFIRTLGGYMQNALKVAPNFAPTGTNLMSSMDWMRRLKNESICEIFGHVLLSSSYS